MMVVPDVSTGPERKAFHNIAGKQGTRKIVSKLEGDTFAIGSEISAGMKPGDLLLLSGELGSGKTVFVNGLASGLGIKQRIKSPTFNIINVYTGGRIDLYHIDLYRLETETEMESTGIFDCIYSKRAVCAVEWGNRIERFLNKSYISLTFYHLGQDRRIIEIDDHLTMSGNLCLPKS